MTGLEPPSRAKASRLMPSGRFIFSGLALTSGLRSSTAEPRGTPRMSLTSVCVCVFVVVQQGCMGVSDGLLEGVREVTGCLEVGASYLPWCYACNSSSSSSSLTTADKLSCCC